MTASLPVTGNTNHTQPENRAFYPALDGFRAVAFLMVFLAHFENMPWGWAGVDLFFVLSGFLITGILFDTRHDPHRIRNFYIRRTLRIFPLFYAVLFVLLLLSPVVHWQWNWQWLIWPLYLGNLARLQPVPLGSPAHRLATFQLFGHVHGHNPVLLLGHFWSLCVEEQFYLVWPCVVFSLRSRHRLLWLCAASLPLCLIARIAAPHVLPAWSIDSGVTTYVTPFRIDSLLAGGLLALLLRGPYRQQVLRFARHAPSTLIPLALVGALALGRHTDRLHYRYPGWTPTLGFTLIAIAATLLIAACLDPGTWLSVLLSTRPLRWAGRLTYGAYIFHDMLHIPLYGLLNYGHPVGPHVLTVVALVFTYVLAWLSFRFFETPFLNLKQRWTVGPPSHAPALSPSPP